MTKSVKERWIEQQRKALEESRPSKKLRMKIRYLVENHPDIPSHSWFAEKVLGIHPNTLTRKYSGERHFNPLEIETCREWFGEDMNIDEEDL